MADMPADPQGQDSLRLSLLSQIVSEIALSIQFGMSDIQLDCLNRASSGAWQWMGLNAVQGLMEAPERFADGHRSVETFAGDKKIRSLGWLVTRFAVNPQKTQAYRDLISELHRALPASISAVDLKLLVDSMRGHMHQLSWAEPWLFRDVIAPLLENKRARVDDACGIWADELTGWLGPDQIIQSRLFDPAREGQTTNTAAFLVASGSQEARHAALDAMQKILGRQQRVLQQPLASTSDWTRWNDALMVSMWIMAFARWLQYYATKSQIDDTEIVKLYRTAGNLALIRSIDDWRAQGAVVGGGLAAFLDQAHQLTEQADPPGGTE